ncbi:hypothetical protein GCM10023219_11030 [Stakelama sediminis]|uniref:GDT1 family protein n=1 Tax=Stakelama sediminis TaxID=463200 RepID=A0A840YW98_9SPHN|nr:TMEM165/GDT1 family protein [Stakelama sediminis]MBB5717827.1 putative Ca2+/H+ antiporter (TMEM165/GDT1 family) [Stakelama sediminis]
MDALVPAVIAALLVQAGDRPPWLAAILADRYRAPVTIFIAQFLAVTLATALAVAAAMAVRPILNPNARTLMLALALLFAGSGAIWRLPKPDRLSGWRIGAFPTAFLGLFILAFGDSTQFLAMGFAIAGAYPVLAGVGTVIGAMVPCTAAIMLGEEQWRRLPMRWWRIGTGIVLLFAGAIAALQALRLI